MQSGQSSYRLINTGKVVMERRGHITTVLTDLLTVLSIQNSLAAFVHLQLSNLDVASGDSSVDLLLVGLLDLAVLAVDVNDVLLTVHLNNLTLGTLSITSENTNLVVLADGDGADLMNKNRIKNLLQ